MQTVSKALATSRKTAPVSLFSPKFLVILSTRRASCKDELCLGLNPNCSCRISPFSLTACEILASRIFQIFYELCPRSKWADMKTAVLDPSLV